MELQNLLSILGKSFSSVTSYDTVATVTQANAEGLLIALAEEDVDKTKSVVVNKVFCKQVDASKYTHKAWPDFRRTMMYLRTEVAFYKHIVPLLKERGFDKTIPNVYDCDFDLDRLVAEDERATDQSKPEPDQWSSTANTGMKGGYIVMEAIDCESDYFQDSPISIEQAKMTLSAVAELHASAWEDTDLLQKADHWLSRGSYHLKTRNVKELAGMEQAWENFSNHFQSVDPELFQQTSSMGKRIKSLAEYISEEISPGPNDQYATLAHGDFKSMNCFLPRSENDRGVIIVDFASTGVGLGMSDVAMHISHAVAPGDLENGGEEELWDHYYSKLCELLGSNTKYPRECALRHYRLAVADYFRFMLGRFWKSATPETMDKKKDSENTALVNRNIDSAFSFLRRVDKYLTQIEKEKEEREQTCTN